MRELGRLETIKQNRHLVKSTRNGDLAEHFPATAEPSIDMEFNPSATDKRVVELVNKTNQFNWNGVRYTEAEWKPVGQNPECFVAVASYQLFQRFKLPKIIFSFMSTPKEE